MKNKSFPALLFLMSVFGFQPVAAANFTSMYVFGDSLSDSGADESSVVSIYKLLNSCDPFHPCPPYDAGRYSNGPTAVEYLADALLPGGATKDNFYNFAVGGSSSGLGNSGDLFSSQTQVGLLNLPAMLQQVAFFSANYSIPDNALFVISGGSNDFLLNGSPQLAAENIANYVAFLGFFGADNFLVPNLPDLSKTPYAAAENQIDAALQFTTTFNQQLALRLDYLASTPEFANKQIIQFDTFGYFNNLIDAVTNNPGAYGFTNAVDACVSLPSVCLDPQTHIFWDDVHPTTQIHALLADAYLSQVPTPGAILFFITGLGTMLAGSMRRKASLGMQTK